MKERLRIRCAACATDIEKIEELADYLKIISDVNRLQILRFLQDGERCVREIHETLRLPQNLTSHHLKTLRDAGLATAFREGRWVRYRINAEIINHLTDLYQKIVLGGDHGNQNFGSTGLFKL